MQRSAHLSTLSAISKNGTDLFLQITNQSITNSKENNTDVTTAQWHFSDHHTQTQAAIKDTSTVPQDSNRSLEKRLALGKKGECGIFILCRKHCRFQLLST